MQKKKPRVLRGPAKAAARSAVITADGLVQVQHRLLSAPAHFFAIFFTLHLPANAQTKGFMNAGVFRACKPGLRLLNFARGELVNNADLLAALAEGQLAAIPSVIRVRVL